MWKSFERLINKFYTSEVLLSVTKYQTGMMIYKDEAVDKGIVKKKGSLWVRDLEKEEGPFDWVIDFGRKLESLQTLVPKTKRISAIIRCERVHCLSHKHPYIEQMMDSICRLANETNPSDPKARYMYRTGLASVYEVMANETQSVIRSKKVLVFAPKNGGIFLKDIFQKAGFQGDWFNYRMKRVMRPSGDLAVGLKTYNNNVQITDYQELIFADDCIASYVSTWGTFEYIKDRFKKAGISTKKIHMLIVTSVASQRSIEILVSKKTLNYFGFASIRAIIGIPAFCLSKKYYLLSPNGSLTVGDMGNWTKGS